MYWHLMLMLVATYIVHLCDQIYLFQAGFVHFDANWMAPWKNRTSRYISFFPPITQWCSVSDVLFTGGMGVSDFSVL